VTTVDFGAETGWATDLVDSDMITFLEKGLWRGWKMERRKGRVELEPRGGRNPRR